MKKIVFVILSFVCIILTAAEPLRVVSLSPAVTEIVCALGGRGNLVARSNACDYPENVKTLPVAGKLGEPNIEVISKLRADVVISDIAVPGADWNTLRKMGVKVILLNSEKISMYRRNVSVIGKVLGRTAEAETECNRFYSEMTRLKKQSSSAGSPKALVLLGINPLVSCNNSSFIGEMLDIAGVSNIAGNVSRTYFVLSPEFVVEKNPDVVILTGMSGDFRRAVEEMRVWRKLGFIKNRAIIDTVPNELFCRLSPRTPLAIELLMSECRKYCK